MGFMVDAVPIEAMSVEYVGREAQAILAYDAIVVEETTPHEHGLALLTALHHTGALPIYVGVPECPACVEETFKQGAGDFLVKDSDGFYLAKLPQIVQRQAHFHAMLMERTHQIETLTAQNLKLAQQVDDLMAFSDSVAHDLKNPITHFLSYADFLRENHASLPEAEIDAHMDIILRQSRKMHEIIDVLLLLARVRQVNDLEISKLNMRAIINDALERLAPEIQEADARIKIPERLPDVLGYAPWVESVWVNYLSNGIKYGGTPPTLHVGAAAENKQQVRFWVADSGDGISAEEQERLFRPFPRIRQPKEKRGHGLGLSIVKRIVEQLDGRVGVKSAPGEGAHFYFTLPAA
ncbi:MAG: HAMP domain-containing histidine kinase [Caldilineaceae bacterium]|nr:HAMP domain-containing histidine kinase [Caldilineaceae bacterium]